MIFLAQAKFQMQIWAVQDVPPMALRAMRLAIKDLPTEDVVGGDILIRFLGQCFTRIQDGHQFLWQPLCRSRHDQRIYPSRHYRWVHNPSSETAGNQAYHHEPQESQSQKDQPTGTVKLRARVTEGACYWTAPSTPRRQESNEPAPPHCS